MIQISIRNGEQCRVFMGSGWEKGKLISKGADRAVVELKGRLVCIYDARNIK